MKYILTPNEMRNADEAMQTCFGVDGLVLMERAAVESYRILVSEGFDLGRVLIVCGRGNNGGDGLALARILLGKNITPEIYVVGGTDGASGSASFQKQLHSLKCMNAAFVDAIPSGNVTTVVDAIFGNSLNREVTGAYGEAVAGINALRDRGARILALDLPSGVDPQTGQVMGCSVFADVTASFGYLRLGQVLYPGADLCGKLILCDVGIAPCAFETAPRIRCLDPEEIRFPERPAYSNKGTFGKLLLIAGSPKICGAAILSGLAAMKSGLGMLKIVTPIENRETLLSMLPEAMFLFYEDDFEGIAEELDRSVRWCDCIAIGPGLGTAPMAQKLVEQSIRQDQVPVVMDADALNILSGHMDLLADMPQDMVITPHVGEMSRLTGLSVPEIASHLLETAADFSMNYRVTCVLKDARTVIADPSGGVVININGNSGMATAGSGDVLTGIIGALIAGGMKPKEAAALGCALHAKSGDKAADLLSMQQLMARDIIKYLKEGEA